MYTLEEWPAAVQVQSKHNTPIEGFWRWKRQGEGHSIRDAILVGKAEGLFNPNNEIHVCVISSQFESQILAYRHVRQETIQLAMAASCPGTARSLL
jgi:hypothetical protein